MEFKIAIKNSHDLLKETGFKSICPCEYHDSEIRAFESVEDINI